MRWFGRKWRQDNGHSIQPAVVAPQYAPQSTPTLPQKRILYSVRWNNAEELQRIIRYLDENFPNVPDSPYEVRIEGDSTPDGTGSKSGSVQVYTPRIGTHPSYYPVPPEPGSVSP